MTSPPELRPLSRTRRKAFADLGSRSGRERRGLFALEGPHAIEDALERGHAFEALVVSEEGTERVREWAEAQIIEADLPVYLADGGELAAIADTETPQGVVAIGRLPDRGLDALPASPGRLVLLADGLQDPGNLGTLLRTLAAVGGRAAICCKGTVDPFNPKALRASAGVSLGLSLATGIERGAALGWCRERGLPVVALETGAPDLFAAERPEPPLALAVGHETAGLSEALAAAAARRVGLPVEAAVDSLSAAVAGSVAMYVLSRFHSRKRSGSAPATEEESP